VRLRTANAVLSLSKHGPSLLPSFDGLTTEQTGKARRFPL
jgi:hypothetical protein